jgi:hypothetical protein
MKNPILPLMTIALCLLAGGSFAQNNHISSNSTSPAIAVSPIIVQPDGTKGPMLSPWWGTSRYGDLVALTEDADDMTVGRRILNNGSLAEKYQMLTTLENEMIALNDLLSAALRASGQKDKINVLFQKLSQKQEQVDLLKSELEDKITQEQNRKGPALPSSSKDEFMKAKAYEIAKLAQQQEVELKSKDDSIHWLSQALAAAKDKAKYYQLTSQQKEQSMKTLQKTYNLKLAQQLIALHQQEEALMEEKGKLVLEQYAMFDRHFTSFENKMKALLANRRFQDMDLRYQSGALKNELGQTQQEITSLKKQLEESIASQKDQAQLQLQIKDLKAQLQAKETQSASGRQLQTQEESFRQKLADQQNKMDLLKQELDSKSAQSDKLTLMIKEYQQKLESKNNAYNEQLGRIADLKARLRQKSTEAQVSDLSLSMIQQKAMDQKIDEYKDKIKRLESANNIQVLEIKNLRTDLALARQQLAGMPSIDEIAFLRGGLKKATMQLKQKDQLLLQAQEYQKEFKAQSAEFKSLKVQLQNAYEEINRKNEDLKYKNLEVVRLKERMVIRHGEAKDALTEKLKQALDKIDEQGRIINTLSAKLEACPH